MPRVVAVVGASRDRHKFVNKAVRAYANRGYEVIPINPRSDVIEGIPSYSSVLDVPGKIDIATIYLQPSEGEQVVDEIVKKGISEVWLNPGADSTPVVARAKKLGLAPKFGCSIVAIGEDPLFYT